MGPILGPSRTTLRLLAAVRALARATQRCEDSRAPGEGAPGEGTMLRTLIVLLLALLGATPAADAAAPETPRLRIIGAAQGLPSTDFFGLARDRDGYIWIATGDGLARYDGLAMRVWRHEPDDARSLPGNNVQFVHVDARDRVWVATENGGLSMLDRDRAGFLHYRKADYPQMGSDDVFAITSRGDDIWFGNDAGGLRHLA